MKTSVALIGFMGVGKSAVSRVLAARLGKKLVEVDSLIEQKAARPIPQIFQEDGEITFRELEIEVIKIIAARKNQVIDCGGGVVLNQINIDRLRENAVIIWLSAAPNIILKRTKIDKEGRPLLSGNRRASDIQSLLRFRKPFYERAADICINTDGADTETIATEITGKLKENADFH
jgi:shikimate kinase